MLSPLPAFLCKLGFALLEYREDGFFDLLSPPPPWFAGLWPLPGSGSAGIPLAQKSPFLENFLSEAHVFWSSNSKGSCQSETWVEQSRAGKEVPLQAIALHLNGKRLLALHSPEAHFHERTELLQTARNALLDHEELQREIQKKEILLHCIIHDLSQPLSVMSVAFDCMAEEQLTGRTKSMLDLGKKASDQQLAMIRDILQVFSADLKASLDSPSHAQSAPDLLICAKSIVTAFTPVYAAKHVRLRINEAVDQRVPWIVRGEAGRIERIFANLLENALRHAPPNSQVTVALQQDGEFIKAFVDDEGPGLPADLSPKQIFALFSKGMEGGGKAGLGLYFCRLTVERWGGSIGCESLPKKGSRFWFCLPKATAVKPDVGSQNAKSPGEPAAVPLLVRNVSVRILLADDQDEIRALTTHQLERSGHHVVAVSNGQEAIEAFTHEPFDVILLDEDMPVMTGPQALKLIRAQEKPFAAKPLVVALTGYNSDPDRERLLNAGFDSVIGKPFRLEALDALLRGATLHREPAPVPQTPSAPHGQTETPVETLLVRVAGDEKLAGKTIATFLRNTPKRMAALQKALQSNDAATVASVAHALKGSISIFGAPVAVDYSRQLQDSARRNDLRAASGLFLQLQEEIAKLEANLRGYAGQKRSPNSGASFNRRRNSNPKRN